MQRNIAMDEMDRENFRTAFNELREEAMDAQEMSLGEIDAEISATRLERRKVSSIFKYVSDIF